MEGGRQRQPGGSGLEWLLLKSHSASCFSVGETEAQKRQKKKKKRKESCQKAQKELLLKL